MRKRLTDLLGGHDDVVWQSLQRLGTGALTASRLLEQRLHFDEADARLGPELHGVAAGSDEQLRQLNRHLHNAFSAPLERDDALALATAFDRVAQVCADLAAALDARGIGRGRHEARRAAGLLTAALEGLVPALAEVAAGRRTEGVLTDARGVLAEGRDFLRQGLGRILAAGLPADQLLSWKDLYDRLDDALVSSRDAERIIDALELSVSSG